VGVLSHKPIALFISSLKAPLFVTLAFLNEFAFLFLPSAFFFLRIILIFCHYFEVIIEFIA
jgi:hypothetical protein